MQITNSRPISHVHAACTLYTPPQGKDVYIDISAVHPVNIYTTCMHIATGILTGESGS